MNIDAVKEKYELLEKREIPDLHSVGYRFSHKKTGARIMILENDDKNKVFTIGFRTPPSDSTGTPHILEHSVLCGSKKFPAKDPFIELAKGSLNTFLNAMTYPDKTVYPVASTNDKDFQNLMDVYMDAVLHPNIYSREEIFKQEGWHYELESAEAPLTYNGVVYNEMKGAFSSPDDVLSRAILVSLYPDTQYANESGGDPAVIPELTYENFKAMHAKYYHPSNSYIYLYGNCDMAEKLLWLDSEYLSEYDRQEIDSKLVKQEPFKSQVYVEKEYSVTEDQPVEGNAYLSYNAVIGDNLDPKLYLAFQILEYALLDVPGAPLSQTLLDRHIGKDIDGSYDNGVYQPYFTVTAKNADLSDKDRFLDTIREVLQKNADEGIDKKALLAGINYFEFRYREADFGQFPKGLMYGLQSFDSWLYDEDKPFMHIEENATFEFLRKAASEGYFEELIRKYLLDNPHSSVVVLKPVRGLTAERDEAVAAKLAEYKNSLSDAEINKLVEDTKALKAYQDEPSTQEELETIPLLSISDIDTKAEPFVNAAEEKNGVNFLHHDIFTNGLSYLTFLFDLDSVPSELAPYAGIWKNLLGQMDTEHYSYADLNNEMNLQSGGIDFSIGTYSDHLERNVFRSMLEVKGRYLESKLGFAFDIVPEVLLTTKLDDKKRLHEVLSMLKSRMAVRMVSSGHSTAVMRATSYFSPSSAFIDEVNGITLYELVQDLDKNFDEKADDLIEKLKTVRDLILRKDNLLIDYTGSKESYGQVLAAADGFAAALSDEKSSRGVWKFEPDQKNEGFRTSSQVQYVAKAADYRDYGLSYTGSLKVLKVMMGYEYLWQNIRVKGGAYGCMSAFGRTGECYMVSYRDPHIKETVDVFDKASDYIESFDATDRDMTKFVIGAISDMDTPLNPRAQGIRSMAAYLGHITFDEVQKERDEVLSTGVKEIRALAPFAKAIREAGNICCIGGEEKVSENADLFKETKTLS